MEIGLLSTIFGSHERILATSSLLSTASTIDFRRVTRQVEAVGTLGTPVHRVQLPGEYNFWLLAHLTDITPSLAQLLTSPSHSLQLIYKHYWLFSIYQMPIRYNWFPYQPCQRGLNERQILYVYLITMLEIKKID